MNVNDLDDLKYFEGFESDETTRIHRQCLFVWRVYELYDRLFCVLLNPGSMPFNDGQRAFCEIWNIDIGYFGCFQ